MVASKRVVAVMGRGRTMEGIDGGPDSCSIPHHCQIGFAGVSSGLLEPLIVSQGQPVSAGVSYGQLRSACVRQARVSTGRLGSASVS